MAMIQCPECGEKISDKAIICPHCGLPLEDENPNIGAGRSIIGIIILILGLFLLFQGAFKIGYG